MVQKNTERVSHKIESLPNLFRDDQLEQIINDMEEEAQAKGYMELTRSGAFVSGMVIWDSPSKNKKRIEYVISRVTTPPFVDTVTKNVYKEDGSGIIASAVITPTRNSQKQITVTNTVLSRP